MKKKILKPMFTLGAALALAISPRLASAQDDLDALLDQLDPAEKKVDAPKAEEKAEAPVVEEKAEEPAADEKSEEPAAEEKSEEPAADAAEEKSEEPAADAADETKAEDAADEDAKPQAKASEEAASASDAEPSSSDSSSVPAPEDAEESPAADEAKAADAAEEKSEEPAADAADEAKAADAAEEKSEEPAADAADEAKAADAADEDAKPQAKASEEAASASDAEPSSSSSSDAEAAKKVDDTISFLDELAAESEADKDAQAANEKSDVADKDAQAANEKSDVADKDAQAANEDAEPKAKASEAAAAIPVAKPSSSSSSSKPVAKKRTGPDAELLENIAATERNRRETYDKMANKEILEARKCMEEKDYQGAVRHYGLARKFLNDSPKARLLRKECESGVTEGLFLAALAEEDLGRHAEARKLMEKALEMRHPKAKEMLAKWKADREEEALKADTSEVAQVRNEDPYKDDRDTARRHLRRARQYLGLRDLSRALDECEIVLKSNPDNQEATRLRKAIQKKRQVIHEQVREAMRDGMIADVDDAWRPVYAVNAAQLDAKASETVKAQAGEDPERTQEQDIEKRMKEMRLPTIEFKPPATIIEAVEFFRTASRDYDRPDIPIEKRGFNFVLRTPVGAIKQAAGDEGADDFSANESEDPNATANGLPPIPKITASDISFYDALKLVCDSVDYKFIVRGPVVMVMQKDMSTAELLSRKYNIPEAFVERVNTASEEMREMGGFGSGNRSAKKSSNSEETESADRDWKAFFEEMGVKWPEGSSIKHIKSLGKLYVRNTRENLAEFEKVLEELGGQPQLIEIETRFVEVSQEDLNSLGFEWILNSDYSLNLANGLGKALGVGKGTWGSLSDSTTWAKSGKDALDSSDSWGTDSHTLDGKTLSASSRDQSSNGSSTLSTSTSRNYSRTETAYGSKNGTWIPGGSSKRSIGVNAIGGVSDFTDTSAMSSSFSNGNRYLSTTGNHISGDDAAYNDQFMRVNAFLGQADLSMILHMLSQRSDTDLLSAPKVVTKSGEQAVIKVVTEYIYPQDYNVQLQSSSSSSGSSSSSSSSGSSAILAVVEPQNFTMREVGVILDVLPTYSEANGGTIDLELKPSVIDEPTWKNYGMQIPFTGNVQNNSVVPDFAGIIDSMVNAVNTLGTTLGASDKEDIARRVVSTSMNAINNLSTASNDSMTWYDAPMEQPFFHVRSIESKVSITPGATVVMGGLITEQRKAMDDKVPFLGDLPFIGRLFRSHAEQTIKRNLLIFVTGRLITPSGREIRMNAESASDAEVKPAPKAE